jgi:hypothetical protein
MTAIEALTPDSHRGEAEQLECCGYLSSLRRTAKPAGDLRAYFVQAPGAQYGGGGQGGEDGADLIRHRGRGGALYRVYSSGTNLFSFHDAVQIGLVVRYGTHVYTFALFGWSVFTRRRAGRAGFEAFWVFPA